MCVNKYPYSDICGEVVVILAINRQALLLVIL